MATDWRTLTCELGKFQEECYAHAQRNGFWDEPLAGEQEWMFLGNKAALIMCEGAELVEAMRSPDPLGPCDKLPTLNKIEEELADIVIRSLDLAERLGLSVAEAMQKKYEYNLTRPYRHNRAF